MNRRDNIILGGIFLFLLVFYILQKTVFKPDPRSFRAELTAFDPGLIDRVQYSHDDQTMEMTKTEKGWLISQNELQLKAKQGELENLLEVLSAVKTKQLVSRNPEKWIEYEVDNNNARKYQLFSGEQLVSALHIGKFTFDQQRQSGTSFARLSDENETYSIEGFLSMIASRNFNSFRENRLLQFESSAIDQIKLISGDLEELVDKSIDGQWIYNGTPLDSALISNYFRNLSNLMGQQFNDDFIPGNGFGIIQSISLGDDITVDNYLNPEGGFVLKSNQNDAFFNSDSSGIFKQIFTDFEDILIESKAK
jgi:hypothetical protein